MKQRWTVSATLVASILIVQSALAAPIKTGPTDAPPPPTPSVSIPVDDEVCDAFSDEHLISGEISQCLNSNTDLLSALGSDGVLRSSLFQASAEMDGEDSEKPKRVSRPPKSPKELADIINSSCRVPGEKPGEIPNRLKGTYPHYNLRSWCCQHSAYLTVVAADRNDIPSQILRVWHGGWHIVSGHECFVDGALRVVVIDYGRAIGYLAPCEKKGGRLCLYNFDGSRRGDYSGFERWAQPGCPSNDIGTFLPTAPGDAPRPPAPACPNGDPYWCQKVER